MSRSKGSHCLFGGTIVAAGLMASHADAQCTPVNAGEFYLSPFPYPQVTTISVSTDRSVVKGGKLYIDSFTYAFNNNPYQNVSAAYLQIWDVSNPNAPFLESISAPRPSTFFGGTSGIALVGNTLIGKSGPNVKLVDISDPVNPAEIVTIDVPGSVSSLRAEGNLMFVCSAGPNQLTIYDLSNPASPQEVGSLPMPFGFVIGPPVGDVLPFSSLSTGLIDISDPTNPVIIGEAAGVVMNEVRLVGNAIVGPRGSNFKVVDVTDPTNPVSLPDFPDPSNSSSMPFEASGLFVFSGELANLFTIDFSNPAAPVLADVNTRPGELVALFVDGGVLVAVEYDGNGDAGIDLYDISGCQVQPVVLSSAVSRFINEGDADEVLSINSTSATSFQWFKDNVALTNGGDFSGVNTPSLFVSSSLQAAGVYTCVASNIYGTDSSAPTLFGVRPDPDKCEADLTGASDPNDPSYGVPDGDIDGDDFFYYLDRFNDGCTP